MRKNYSGGTDRKGEESQISGGNVEESFLFLVTGLQYEDIFERELSRRQREDRHEFLCDLARL